MPVRLLRNLGLAQDAVERVWNIAKKITQKLNAVYLKYLDDIKVSKLGRATTNDYRKNFDDAFPDVRVDMEVHHAFPQELLDNFPDLGFDPKEIHSLENLRGIPNSVKWPLNAPPETPTIRLHSHITNEWKKFFDPFKMSVTSPTFEQIQAFALQIDNLSGQYFKPPIR